MIAAPAAFAAAVVLLAAGCSGSSGAGGTSDAGSDLGSPSASGTPSGGGSGPAADPTTVAVVRLAFAPADLVVPAGTTVTWRSDEPIGHTVTSGAVTGVDPATGLRSGEKPDGRFDAELPTTGATTTYRFTSPGTYAYYCAVHQGMNARVVVR